MRAEDFEKMAPIGPRCYESHPPLDLTADDKTVQIFGGSASFPVVKDADIYISLQSGSSSNRATDPWEAGNVIEVQYEINDGHAPKNLKRFKAMVTWICNQLHEGKKVHVGCIGGHGRTGMVLSAICAQFTGEKDAVQYVRKNYCKKAVETDEQIEFLQKHYGCSYAVPSKPALSKGGWSGFTRKDMDDIEDRWIGRAKGSGSKKIEWNEPDTVRKFIRNDSPRKGDSGHYDLSQKAFGFAKDMLPGYEKPKRQKLSDKISKGVGAKVLNPVASARNLWKNLTD